MFFVIVHRSFEIPNPKHQKSNKFQIEEYPQQAAGNLSGKVFYLILDSLANPVASYGECARWCRFKITII
jgi:hypothetical protein